MRLFQVAIPTACDCPSQSPYELSRLAVRALLHELVTYPKPGLVSRVDNGSHDDMDAAAFIRSAFALRRYFAEVAAAGRAGASLAVLRNLGIAAEQRMLRATGGVNTHRGAIFMLGLLVAAAGARVSSGASLGDLIRDRWGRALSLHRRDDGSHGAAASERYRVGGAVEEAAAGMPTLFAVALPAYRTALSRGASSNQARVQAFFASMSTLSDTNLLHRGGRRGLDDAKREAHAFLMAGGVFAHDWRRHAVDLHASFCSRRLSPGGSADMLAACLFVHAVDGA
jgi:triphosphoribosyl-dephospho-CoA synthase